MWNSAKGLRDELTAQLALMALGIRACMYCGGCLSTGIDHFEPLTQAPLRAFDWLNHLLACAHCNSHQKRDLFPRDEQGRPLLIDPSSEDPDDHLELMLATGTYEALTPRGEATIDVFGLNRDDLVRSRRYAVIRTASMLRDRSRLLQEGDTERAGEVLVSLLGQPFAGVLHAMLRYRDLPGAALVLGGQQVVDMLADPTLHL
ncbi:HNH endonuclease [Sphaerimonospora cavernae]|uniref:HNH endonuclease n=1 Tax=Sphaerimonospora cavernae TaxID=1740611 RepID=A0ABV6UC34_9ACTN